MEFISPPLSLAIPSIFASGPLAEVMQRLEKHAHMGLPPLAAPRNPVTACEDAWASMLDDRRRLASGPCCPVWQSDKHQNQERMRAQAQLRLELARPRGEPLSPSTDSGAKHQLLL